MGNLGTRFSFLGLVVACCAIFNISHADERAPLTAIPPGGPILIAHALGGMNGVHHLNCKECFLNAYSRGFRYFETDFSETSDHRIINFHPGFEKRSELPLRFSWSEYMGRKILGQYTPLDLDEIAALMEQKTDWKLISDFKSNSHKGLDLLCEVLRRHSVSCEERVIPQFYSFGESSILDRIRFSQSIFMIFELGPDFPRTRAFLKSEPRISALSYPIEWLNVEPVRTTIQSFGVQQFVWVANDPAALRRASSLGIDGFYTDYLAPSSLQ